MILVAGATGMVGGEVCRLLRSDGKPVRALVRATSKPEKVEGLRALGCELVTGDLRDPPSLVRACAGAEAVVSTVSAMPFSWDPAGNTVATVDYDGQRRLIDAAAGAGAHRFLLVTFSGNNDRPFPLRDAKRAAEQHLRESGLPFTIVRPSFFSEVWLSPAVGFDPLGGQATIYGDGFNRISWISYLDVARFVVTALGSVATADQTLELGGPEALTPLEVVRIFEAIGGRHLKLTHVPVPALEARLAAATDDFQRSFAALMLGYAAGDEIHMGATLSRFQMQLTPVDDVARRMLEPAHAHA